jgi:hypothetical protein
MQREIETLAAPSAATHRVFGTPINRGVVFSVSLDLGGSHPVHFDRDQGIAGLSNLNGLMIAITIFMASNPVPVSLAAA